MCSDGRPRSHPLAEHRDKLVAINFRTRRAVPSPLTALPDGAAHRLAQLPNYPVYLWYEVCAVLGPWLLDSRRHLAGLTTTSPALADACVPHTA